jgi:putative MATE family efflux protein
MSLPPHRASAHRGSAHRAQIRRVATLAVPAAVQGLVATVLMFTDRLILGRYHADALASMQISSVVMWSVFSIAMAWMAGIVAVVGRATGAGDRERASAVAGTSVALAAGIGLGAAVVMWPLLGPIAGLLGSGDATSPAVRAMAIEYMAVMLCGSVPAFAAAAGMSALQAAGDTRTPARAAVVAGVANLVLTWGLVFGELGLPEWGVAGAAVGSAVAFVLQLGVILHALGRARGPLGLGRPRWAVLPPVLRIALPAFGERVLYQAGFLVFGGMVGRLGDVAMAANQSLMAIESLGFIGADAFGIAGGALVAQRLGADDADDARRVGWWSTGLGIAVLGGVGLFFFIAAEPLVALFSDDPAVIALGARCLRIAAVAQPLMAAVAALGGALRGAGDTRTPMLAALVGPIGVRLVACWFLAFELGWGLWGIWIGSTLDWAVRAVWLGAAFRRERWRTIRV